MKIFTLMLVAMVSSQLTKELGAAKKHKFLLDITMEKSLEHLFTSYDIHTDSASVAILKRYSNIQLRLATTEQSLK